MWLWSVVLVGGAAQAESPLPLPSSKLLGTVPGEPQRTNAFPTAAAVSPDGRWVAVLAGGFGTPESKLAQSVVIEDRTTGTVVDQPDPRFVVGAHQTYFLGLAFSSDGHRLYASVASLSDPTGAQPDDLGNGVAIYDFADGHLAQSGFLKLPLRELAADRHPVAPIDGVDPKNAVPYPAGLAVVPGRSGDRLLVAENLADDAVLVDVSSGEVQARFDLAIRPEVPAAYPYATAVSPNGKVGWVSLWNGSAIAQLDLRKGTVKRLIPLLTPASETAAGSHPTAMLPSRDGKTLYVTLANADAVALVDPKHGTVRATWSTRLPGSSWGGTIPNALALSPDGTRLYVAVAGANAVAVYDTHGDGAPLGLLPTEWYPTALAAVGDDLLVVTGKGRSTGPNSGPPQAGSRRNHPYIATLIHGSLARVNVPGAMADLPALTAEVATSNRLGDAAPTTLPTAIRHVVYIIRENRTFDQILGDLGAGDGDPSLLLYGQDVTPNLHALVRQYGILDRFLCSGEVSGNGHVWSTAATTSDYTEKTWPIGYRSDERYYDYEGEVSGAVPLETGTPDVDEPGTGYLWANAERNGVSHRNYGEYVVTRWCDDPETLRSAAAMGTPVSGTACPKPFTQPGEAFPDGSANPWPWPVPILGVDVATKAELRDHFDPAFADFRLDYPDVMRADEFLRELHGWEQARTDGAEDPMPRLIVLRLPNDHTSGTRPGLPTPSAAVADNDLAVGKVVAGISAGAYWSDTAIFAVEDDAQDGADHVDAHRSPVLVASRFAPHPPADGPFVDSTDYTTVSVVRTIEVLLGLPPMNQNDAYAPVMEKEFSGPGDAPPFVADYRARDGGLLFQMNPPEAKGGSASLELDFRHADSADSAILNQILWEDRHPGVPMPTLP